MKSFRFLLTIALVFLGAVQTIGQTADEVIDKYLKAIGGKENISQIKSFYTEGKMAVMGMEATTKVTVLNGVGLRQESEMMNTTSISSLSEKGGWSINPQTGSPNAVDMTPEQFNAMKGQMVLGAPFINLQSTGTKAEIAGTENIDGINATKILLTKTDNTTSAYYFDTMTNLLIRSDQKMKMRGQEVDTVISFSDYKDAGNGYSVPFKTEVRVGEVFKMVTTITKAEINKAVDPAIFNKP